MRSESFDFSTIKEKISALEKNLSSAKTHEEKIDILKEYLLAEKNNIFMTLPGSFSSPYSAPEMKNEINKLKRFMLEAFTSNGEVNLDKLNNFIYDTKNEAQNETSNLSGRENQRINKFFESVKNEALKQEIENKKEISKLLTKKRKDNKGEGDNSTKSILSSMQTSMQSLNSISINRDSRKKITVSSEIDNPKPPTSPSKETSEQDRSSEQENISEEMKVKETEISETARHIIKEIHSSEKKFIADITAMCEGIKKYKNSLTLQEKIDNEKFLNQLDIFMIPYNNIMDHANLNSKLLENNNLTEFNKYLHTGNFLQAIEEASLNFQNNQVFIEECNKNKKLAEFFPTQNATFFSQIAIVPVQRTPRYQMLALDLNKNLPEKHRLKNVANNIMESAISSARKVDDEIRNMQLKQQFDRFDKLINDIKKSLDKFIKNNYLSSDEKKLIAYIRDNLHFINEAHYSTENPLEKFKALQRALNELRIIENNRPFMYNLTGSSLESIDKQIQNAIKNEIGQSIEHNPTTHTKEQKLKGVINDIHLDQKKDLKNKIEGKPSNIGSINLKYDLASVYADPSKLKLLKDTAHEQQTEVSTNFYGRYLEVKSNLTSKNIEAIYQDFIKPQENEGFDFFNLDTRQSINITHSRKDKEELDKIIQNLNKKPTDHEKEKYFLENKNKISALLDTIAKEVASDIFKNLSLEFQKKVQGSETQQESSSHRRPRI
jgi:hypothetical protein